VTDTAFGSDSFASDGDFLTGVATCGNLLGVLFLERPNTEDCGTAARALVSSPMEDVWPFGAPEALSAAGRLIVSGWQEAQTVAGMEALVREYNRLFVGPALKPAPPWGSVYLDRDCVMFGGSCMELREWMRINGVVSLESGNMPEDHIGTMLMLAATLAQKRPDLLGEFLQNHLLIWAPHFLGELEAATQAAFYRGLAMLTAETFASWEDLLQLEVPVRRFYR